MCARTVWRCKEIKTPPKTNRWFLLLVLLFFSIPSSICFSSSCTDSLLAFRFECRFRAQPPISAGWWFSSISIYLWKGEAAPLGLKIWKNIQKWTFVNYGRPPFGPTRSGARQPVETRSNPRWRRKNLANAILAGFRRIFRTLRGRFPLIPSIFGESAVTRHDQYHHHRVLCSLA